MTLQNFIKENREAIDFHIKKIVPNAPMNNEERKLWVLNDEGLYRFAKRCGVKI